MRKGTWTQEELQVLRDHYITIENVMDLAPLLPNRGYNAIKAQANLLGLIRKVYPTKDENFFDTPNELNSWLSGFVAADGCITHLHHLTFVLAQKDIEYLYKIKDILKYTGNILQSSKMKRIKIDKVGADYVYEAKTGYLSIPCAKWKIDLEKHWNITPRKTYTLKAPNITDHRQIAAFLSGAIDGDGWIVNCKCKTKKFANCNISLMGTKELISWFKFHVENTFLSNGGDVPLKPTGSPNNYEYTLTGAKCYWFAKLLLALNIPRLDRKWNKMREFITFSDTQVISKQAIHYKNLYRPSPEILKEFNLDDFSQPQIQCIST